MTRIYSLISNPYLPEVTRVVLVHHNPVVVLATRVTATGRVLAVLANTTMTRGHVTALLAVLVSLLGRKFGERVKRYVSFWFAWSVTSSSSRHAPGDRVAGASMPNPRSSHANAKSRWRAGQRRKAVVATRHRPSRDTDSDVGGVRTCVGILKPFAVCRAACATTKRVARWPDDADEKACAIEMLTCWVPVEIDIALELLSTDFQGVPEVRSLPSRGSVRSQVVVIKQVTARGGRQCASARGYLMLHAPRSPVAGLVGCGAV